MCGSSSMMRILVFISEDLTEGNKGNKEVGNVEGRRLRHRRDFGYRKNRVYARPHSGPLPRGEREALSRSSDDRQVRTQSSVSLVSWLDYSNFKGSRRLKQLPPPTRGS